MRKLYFIVSFLITCFLAEAGDSSFIIDVEAGDATTICYGETLNLEALGASISGDVFDGLWFSYGDGIFLPGGESNGIFSSTTQYQPGQQDQANGTFTLILVSDDPDGNGPMVEVSDEVVISFMTAPALVCNNSINVSLSEGCEQEVDVFMLVANPTAPIDKYSIQLYDADGEEIPNATLNVDHIGTDVTFVVSHDCSSSFCDGNLSVSDNIAPFLNCINTEIDCQMGYDPEIAGFPIPFYATATENGENSYSVENFDDCGLVTLTYTDVSETQECAATGFVKEITRIWEAEDEAGNTSLCNQIIMVRPLPIDSVTLPPNYDGVSNPPLSCDGDWIALENGHPSPESTGTAIFPDCGNIATNYVDVYFEECGAGFKILRKWDIIDWCPPVNTIQYNQVIKVLDTIGPVFECPADMTLSTDAYSCTSVSEVLSFVDDVYDCSEYDYSFQLQDQTGLDVSSLYVDGATIDDLPVGEYSLLYIATDACGNSSDCAINLTVEDDSAPFAVCDGFTQVSVGSFGTADLYATSVDDDSFDNCGTITMEVAKMTDECGWGLDFSEKVRFCCSEIGDSLLVAFRVTDEQGLSNTCMVTVYIDDKLPPVIECPSDLTISCNYFFDETDLSEFGVVNPGQSAEGNIEIDGEVIGVNGYYFDNCSATVEEESNVMVECGEGVITRNFTATDLYGQSANCVQTITVVNDNPFLNTDISWPTNFEMEGCDTIQANPSVTGYPILANDKCALASSTYQDQFFFISGGACVKVLREWTVIDWCQFDSDTGDGLWTYVQEIKLKNTIAPTFLTCANQDICSYDDDCQSEEVTITVYANDDCTDSLQLLYLWSLDLDDDGVIDESGEGISFVRELNLGEHRVFWTVEDGCGNSSQCDYTLDVRDCKNPTPYCRSSITTTIMPVAGQIDIWATDFNIASYDNCTAPEDLDFSFSQDINDTQRVIRCEDLENGVAQLFEMEMWVTDEWGNQERCSVTFIVQDNADYCPNGTIKGKIQGRVVTQKDKYLPDAEVDIVASIDTFSGFEMTNQNGDYSYEEVPELLSYTLRPHYNSSARGGVTTLDLVKIQQHILEIKPFDNPYDIIASDVSQNQRITSSDLVTMRKMILGIIEEWPKEISNWVFVDSSFVFEEVDYPFDYPDSIRISYLNDTTGIANFVAIKMGDINSSYSPSFSGINDDAEKRTIRSIDATLAIEEGEESTANLYIETGDDLVDGLQFSLSIPAGSQVISTFLTENDYYIDGNVLKVAWLNAGNAIIDGEPFLSVISRDKTDYLFTSDLSPEVYIDQEIYTIQYSVATNHIASSQRNQMVIHGNPFSGDLRISLVDEVTLVQIFNSSGVLVYSTTGVLDSDLIVPSSTFTQTGLYFVQSSFKDKVEIEKVIKI